MQLKYLDGRSLYESVMSGTRELVRHKRVLNEINIFPVPDGDTGNNLASTVQSIVKKAIPNSSAKESMRSIAGAALTGARGDSGRILAYYLQGIYESMGDRKEFNLVSFGNAVKTAVPYAYRAVSKPVEGTILSVISTWAEAVEKQTKTALDFYELLDSPLQEAYKAVEDTRVTLRILEEANVVDAGAKGFFCFVSGITEYVKGGMQSKEFEEYELETVQEIKEHGPVLGYRYCVEVMVEKEKESVPIEKEELEEWGDTIIILDNKDRVRIHIHTDFPQYVIQAIRIYGRIINHKVEDMQHQYELLHGKGQRIALITDSIANIPKNLSDKYQINIIPLNISIEGELYQDGLTMTSDIFYPLIENSEEFPIASPPEETYLEAYFEQITNKYKEIIVIAAASIQSSTYELFTKMSKKYTDTEIKLEVIDSRLNSVAQGFLVLEAAELIQRGNTYETVISEVLKRREKIKIYVCIENLEFIIRSGRVSKARGKFGKLLKMKPILTINPEGRGVVHKRCLSINASKKAMIHILNKHKKKMNTPISKYAIVYSGNKKRATELSLECKEIFGAGPAFIVESTPILASIAGIGSVGIAFIEE